jgi:hypothetical protein
MGSDERGFKEKSEKGHYDQSNFSHLKLMIFCERTQMGFEPKNKMSVLPYF